MPKLLRIYPNILEWWVNFLSGKSVAQEIAWIVLRIKTIIKRQWKKIFCLLCNQNVSNAVDGMLLNDLLLVQKENNLTLPAWTDSVFPEKLLLIAEQGLKVRTQTPYLKLVRGGPMVSRIFNQMLHKQNRKTPNRSIYIYSGHDATLMSVMRLLNLNNQTAAKPHYGATLAFELHCSTDGDCGQHAVRVSFHAKMKIILIW